MGRHPQKGSGRAWRLWVGCLLPMAVVTGGVAPRAAHGATTPGPAVVKSHKPKPRAHLAVGDHWRVRASELPMQVPNPAWLPAETWVFAVTGLEKTPDGPRLMVTVTREDAARPMVRLQLDPDTQAIVRADTLLPVQGGERTFVERGTPGEPFISDVSPVPIALPAPMPGLPKPKAGTAGTANAQPGAAPPAAGSGDPGPGDGQPAAIGGPPQFTFGQRITQRTEPVDAGVGRAMIERGMAPLKRHRGAGLEPAGIARFLTTIEGSGRRIEQVWDDTTPWPIYTESQTSRSWLVDYKKGK
jgi:hypothetical protein